MSGLELAAIELRNAGLSLRVDESRSTIVGGTEIIPFGEIGIFQDTFMIWEIGDGWRFSVQGAARGREREGEEETLDSAVEQVLMAYRERDRL